MQHEPSPLELTLVLVMFGLIVFWVIVKWSEQCIL